MIDQAVIPVSVVVRTTKTYTIKLKASADKQAYSQMNIRCPKHNSCNINVVRDTVE